jgi:hypothetical protein
MANARKLPRTLDLAERARFFGVCERTVRRWHNSGADLRSVESVADLLIRQRAPKTLTLEKLTSAPL